jgi:hypothetical protein
MTLARQIHGTRRTVPARTAATTVKQRGLMGAILAETTRCRVPPSDIVPCSPMNAVLACLDSRINHPKTRQPAYREDWTTILLDCGGHDPAVQKGCGELESFLLSWSQREILK